MVRGTLDGPDTPNCAGTGSGRDLVDKAWLKEFFPAAVITKVDKGA